MNTTARVRWRVACLWAGLGLLALPGRGADDIVATLLPAWQERQVPEPLPATTGSASRWQVLQRGATAMGEGPA